MKAVRPIVQRLPLLVSLFALACVPVLATSVATPIPGSEAFRVVEPARGSVGTVEGMVRQLGRSDVVFFGEQHDDPETHRAEALVLGAIGELGRPVILSLEMFERDVQRHLDEYLAGRIAEADFIARSRPWPRYATDYRPLVEIAKSRGWRVIAANVPRPLASAVGRRGLSVLDTLSAAERLRAAREVECPADAYRARFMEQMRSHGPGPGGAGQAGDSLPTAVAERFYLAQCLKDETMAESIVEARRAAGGNAIVVHFNGAFHSDFSQGTADRVRRREPRWRIAVVTAVPVSDPAAGDFASMSRRADFVIFTRAPAAAP